MNTYTDIENFKQSINECNIFELKKVAELLNLMNRIELQIETNGQTIKEKILDFLDDLENNSNGEDAFIQITIKMIEISALNVIYNPKPIEPTIEPQIEPIEVKKSFFKRLFKL
jgi:hypothetical protein